MKKLLIFFILLITTEFSYAEMVLNTLIGNDPVKERLCAERSQQKPVPFEIELRYVKTARSFNPDATFIASDGDSPQLIKCFFVPNTGKFQPATISPEQSYWHILRPKSFEPGLESTVGRDMVSNACLQAYLSKTNRPNPHSTVMSGRIMTVGISNSIYMLNKNRNSIGGKKTERYDIVTEGQAFYKSSKSDIDLDAAPFACLFSPMLELKAVQFKW